MLTKVIHSCERKEAGTTTMEVPWELVIFSVGYAFVQEA